MNLETVADAIEHIPLERCRFGHEHPLANVNSRRTSPTEAAERDFRASLREKGQLQPGRAFPAEDGSGDVYFFIGNRRLKGLRDNADEHMDAPRTMSAIIDRKISPREALELSLVENEQREPLHPVDRYEDYAELKAQGLTEDEIAARHGLVRSTVRRYLKLGALSPKVRAAWRAGEIDDRTAQTFTLAPDVKAQDRLFKKLQNVGQLYAHRVRSELIPEEGDPRFLNFVGVDAFIAAGGTVIEDLFEGQHGISDPVLAKSLADRKLEAECARMKEEEGWSWIERADLLPRNWQGWARSDVKIAFTTDEKLRRGVLESALEEFEEGEPFENEAAQQRYETLEAEYLGIEQQAAQRSYTDRQKKKSGLVVWIDAQGRLARMMGVIRPPAEEVAKIPALTPAAPDGKVLKAEPGAVAPPLPAGEEVESAPKAPAISAGHLRALRETFGEAVRVALEANPSAAVSGLLACMTIGSGPFDLSGGALSRVGKLCAAKTFPAALAELHKMKPADQLYAMGSAAAALCDVKPSERGTFDSFEIALLDTLGVPAMTEVLRKRHNFGEDFERRPKPLLLEAVREALGAEESERLKGLTREKLTAHCKASIAQTGWLPPELRFPGYALPKTDAKPAAKKAVKKAAPAKVKKKARK